ncbi:MAG: DNA-binding response regulator [Bdellovibrio sp. CG10_big_fil_rev_8_21_14_0_10_47_8]|nr:MAG: DNA-binding response regulator [Bdellovibrio sp. CG10_big_fil_rev_8_21_14_0_10_47_8]
MSKQILLTHESLISVSRKVGDDMDLQFIETEKKPLEQSFDRKNMAVEKMRVLIVEDESEIREFLVSQFTEAGAAAQGLPSGENILQALEAFQPTIVLLDQMMPGKSGREIVAEVRRHARFCELPIIIVTGLDGEAEKIQALELGADDYVTKPFSVRELIARSHALVRRSQAAHRSQQNNLVVKELVVDFSAHRVTKSGKEVPLTLTEFKILCELLKQSGQVLTRDKLRERALGNLNVTDRTIDVHMASLRKKLDEMGDSIETVRGVGYRMSL